jgi:hypothetical protein
LIADFAAGKPAQPAGGGQTLRMCFSSMGYKNGIKPIKRKDPKER